MNWDNLVKAINMNGVTDIVLNKMDVLREVDHWRMYSDENLLKFDGEQEMKEWISHYLSPKNITVYFSENKDRI